MKIFLLIVLMLCSFSVSSQTEIYKPPQTQPAPVPQNPSMQTQERHGVVSMPMECMSKTHPVLNEIQKMFDMAKLRGESTVNGGMIKGKKIRLQYRFLFTKDKSNPVMMIMLVKPDDVCILEAIKLIPPAKIESGNFARG